MLADVCAVTDTCAALGRRQRLNQYEELEDCPHWLACVHSRNWTVLKATLQTLQSHAPNSLEDLLWLVYGEDGQCDDSNNTGRQSDGVGQRTISLHYYSRTPLGTGSEILSPDILVN